MVRRRQTNPPMTIAVPATKLWHAWKRGLVLGCGGPISCFSMSCRHVCGYATAPALLAIHLQLGNVASVALSRKTSGSPQHSGSSQYSRWCAFLSAMMWSYSSKFKQANFWTGFVPIFCFRDGWICDLFLREVDTASHRIRPSHHHKLHCQSIPSDMFVIAAE